MSVNLLALRNNVVTAVQGKAAAFTAYPLMIEYDNQLVVDTVTQSDPFLCIKIKFLDGEQADLSSNPMHRVFGQIHIAAAVKENAGSVKALELLNFFYPSMQMTALGLSPRVRTKAATFATPTTHNGWVYTPVVIPFWCDGNTN